MRLEDLKNDIPKTPEHIHQMIEDEVQKQLRETEFVPVVKRAHRRWVGAKAAVAAIVCVLVTSSIAYAGVKWYVHLEQTGKYSVEVGVKKNNGTNINDSTETNETMEANENAEAAIPKEIPAIRVVANYIPEGMEWHDEFHLEHPEMGRQGGFSFTPEMLLDNNDRDIVMELGNIVESEKRFFGDFEGIYLRYHDLKKDGSFNQRIYLFCPEYYRAFLIFVGDDVTKEEAVKLVENLEIIETDEMIQTAKMYTWSEEVSSKEGEIDEDEKLVSIEEQKLPVHQIGDVFDLWISGEDAAGNYMEQGIKVSVDKLEIADDLHLLGDSKLPEEWEDVLDSNGKLKQNTLSYIKSGNGVDTIDEVVKTEDVKQKLVYATVTYTNDTDTEITHMAYMGSLMLIENKDDKYQIYLPALQSGDGYDYVMGNGAARVQEMVYYSVTEDYEGRNYIPSLKPGESIQVNMAWIVNECDMHNMYLSLNGINAFSDDVIETGIVDIKQ